MAAKKKPVSFEKALTELETLVDELETGEMTLEQSLKAFEKGVKLCRDCRESLSAAERKVQQLITEHTEEALEPFDEDQLDDI